MRITVLLRYPRVERSSWKRELVEQLIERDHRVSLVFGESSYIAHARAAVRNYGSDLLARRRTSNAATTPRLIDHFGSRSIDLIRTGDLNGKRTQTVLRNLNPDLILLLGTGIIRKPALDIPRIGTLHCHQGCLPDYRGVNTIEWSLYQGHRVYITTHFVDPGIDTGRILRRQSVPVRPGDTIASLRARCHDMAVGLLLSTIDDLGRNAVRPVDQSPAAGRQYFSMHPFFRDQVEVLLQQAGHSHLSTS